MTLVCRPAEVVRESEKVLCSVAGTDMLRVGLTIGTLKFPVPVALM